MGLADQLQKMSPREQRLLTILAVVFGALIFIGIPLYFYSDLTAARDRNDEIRELLRRTNKGRELFAKRKQERESVERRFARKAPELASFIESSAKGFSIDVPDTSNGSQSKHQGYTERTTVAKFRKVGLKPLVKMLEKIKRSNYPVAITELSIKARASGPDLYDVQLAVSAYDKTKKSAESKTPAKGATK